MNVAMSSPASPQGAAPAIEEQVAVLNEEDVGHAQGEAQARKPGQ